MSTLEERYERHEALGQGGIGTVYRGTHIPLQRPVAIKEIKEVFSLFGDLKKDELIQRFEKTVQRHAKLVHPNIVQLIDIDVDRQYPIFVMEYATRGSLRRLMDSEQRPSLSERLRTFLQIAQGLKHAHEMGVLHTDLKPENVLFDREGNAKLVDFGVTQILKSDIGEQRFYIGGGNPAYLPPEQFRNPGDVSVQADIYSLGLIFYEILTGKLHGRRSPMPSSFFPNIPRKLDDIFDKMCMDDPDDRYDSVAAILEEFTSSEEVLALIGPGTAAATASHSAADAIPATGSGSTLEAVSDGRPSGSDVSSESTISATPSSSPDVVAVASMATSDDSPPAEAAPEVTNGASHDDAPELAAAADEFPDGLGTDSSSLLSKLDKYGQQF